MNDQRAEIPCPMCCQHVKLENELVEKGGIATCKKCGYKFRLSGRQKNQEVQRGG